jgi:hypothetical protein
MESKMLRKVCLLSALMLPPLLAAEATAQSRTQTVLLDFDDFEAPSTFAEAQPFTTQYQSAGVVFSGRMEVLNEQGNFGVVEHSATAFLAWNTTVDNKPPETLTFLTPVSNFSFNTGSVENGTVTATAYDASGKQLATQTVTLVTSAIPVVLDVENISRVVITSTAIYGAIDDVEFVRSLSDELSSSSGG